MMIETITTVGEFAETVKRELETIFVDSIVEVHSVIKNNGIKFLGIVIREKDTPIAPVMYLDAFYEEYKNGKGFYDIIDEIGDVYRDCMRRQVLNISEIMDYETVKDKICFKLINAEKNRELLADIPHKEFLDLAIVCYVLFCNNEMGTGTYLIRNNILEQWGNLEVDELFDIAKENTRRLLKANIISMAELILSYAANDSVEDFSADMSEEISHVAENTDKMMPMYICSNESKLYGAVVILYEGILEDFAKKVGGDYYILPSSVHETIFLVKDEDVDETSVKQMVSEVNQNIVPYEEILSDSVYVYHADTGRVEIV